MHTNALAGTIVEHLRTADKAVEAVLPTLTRKLVKTRASQINGCSFCLDMHTKEAIRAGETPQRLNLVAAWKEAKGFTAAEGAALELAEQSARIATGHGVTDDAWARRARAPRRGPARSPRRGDRADQRLEPGLRDHPAARW